MALCKYRLVLPIFLITLLSLTVFANIPPSNYSTISASISPLGSGNYAESFATTTYRDAGATTAEGWGTGYITNPHAFTVTQLDYNVTGNPVRDLDVQGRRLYAVEYAPSGEATVDCFNITDPSNLQTYSNRASWDHLLSCMAAGDILFAGVSTLGGGKVSFYNVSNPYYLDGGGVYITNIGIDGSVTDIDVQGHFIYATGFGSASTRAFVIIDVEDPYNPVRIPNLWGSDTALGVDVEGYYAYIAESHYGLWVCNVSNPYSISQPSPGFIDTPGNATAVLVDGSFAYVADGPSGVQIIDISDPSTPTIIGSCDTPGNAQKLALQGKTLFVADGTGGVQVLDVTDPYNPVIVTAISSLPYTYAVALYGGDLVVGAYDGVYTYRIGSGMADLPFIGSYDDYEVWDVRVQGDIAYVAAGPDGFLTLDVSDPTNPVLLDLYNPGVTLCAKLDVQGHIVCLFDNSASGAFYILDVSDPSNIQVMATVPANGCIDVFMHCEVVFYSFNTGFGCVNISDPYNPSVIFNWSGIATNMTALWVEGYHLYIVEDLNGGGLGFHIYDITTINSPSLISSYSLTSTQYDVFVDGEFAYCANDDWLSVRNVTDPTSITYTDTIYDTTNTSLGVWGFGPYIVSARGSGGVRLVDATNVYDIKIISNYAAATGATQVTVHGDYAYVANRSSLVILRLFWSAGATFAAATAQSTEVDTTDLVIENATLAYTGYTPFGTSLAWFMSADGGSHWESVTPGVMHTFTNTGTDLRWRVEFNSPLCNPSQINSVSIDYGYIDILTPPIPGFPLVAIAIGAFLGISFGLIRRRRT